MARPPWAVAAFVDHCSRCDACLRACPERVLIRGDGGFPELDFTQGGCSFCGDCVGACEAGALDFAAGERWSWRAAVDDSCLARQGVYCRTCADFCDQRAIRFQLQLGGRAAVAIDALRCNGCGACQAPCPGGAIRMQREST